MSEPTVRALKILFDEARHVLELQTSAIDSFDDKAATLLRFTVLLLGVSLTGISVGIQIGAISTEAPLVLMGLGLTMASLFASALCTVVAYRELRWNIGLRGESLRRALGYEADERRTLLSTLRTYSRILAENTRRIGQASRWLDRGVAALMAALLLGALTSTSLWWGKIP